MVAVEKGTAEKSASLTSAKIAGIYKDVVNRLDEAVNYFEDALKSLSSGAKSDFKKYYMTYCAGMRTYHEVLIVNAEFLLDRLLVPLCSEFWRRTEKAETRMLQAMPRQNRRSSFRLFECFT